MPLSAGKKLTNGFASILRSPFLFVFLAGLYPVAFKSSKNWFLLRDALPTQIVALFVMPPMLALGTAICLYGFFVLLRAVLVKSGLKTRFFHHAEGIKIILCMVTACTYMIFYLDIAVKNALLLVTGFDFRYRVIYLVTFVTLVPLLVLYARRVGTKYMNIVLIALISFSFAELCFNLLTKPVDLQEAVGMPSARAKVASIHFKTKPNVYLVVLDSYANDAALKKIFRTDNTAFRHGLLDRGFRIYDNAYSNYVGTLQSMQSVFSMQHHYYKNTAGFFDSLVARSIISANAYNPVLDVFKRNGYSVRYIHDSQYLCPNPGNSINSFTFYRPSPPMDHFFPQIFEQWLKVEAYLPKDISSLPGHTSESQKRLKDIDAALAHSSKPFFMYIHTFKPFHARFFPFTMLEYFEREYPLKVHIANVEAINIIDLIVARDPSAFIIVMGDHGPFRYGNLWMKSRGEEDQLNGVSKADLGMDLLGILLAVRFPNGYDKRFDTAVITPVNLFRYVFAELSKNDDVLNDKVRDESYVAVSESHLFVAAVDGRPLQRWAVFSNMTAKLGNNNLYGISRPHLSRP